MWGLDSMGSKNVRWKGMWGLAYLGSKGFGRSRVCGLRGYSTLCWWCFWELGVLFDKPVAKTLVDSFLFRLKKPKYVTV